MNKNKEFVTKFNAIDDFALLFNRLNKPIKHNNLITTFIDEEFRPPAYLVQEISKRINFLKMDLAKKNVKFFDDVIARLNNWDFQRDDVLFTFSKTSYFHFAALNMLLDMPLDQKQKTLRNLLDEDPLNLEYSLLPNPLGINISLFLEKEQNIVYITK